ncbi:MAG: NAD(P)H-binding protein [Nitrospirota bacterium]
MTGKEIHIVTGALGYSGKYITKRLLDEGHHVRTLTNSPDRPNPFGERIQVYPFNFNDTARLVDSLRGASVLYNTYWVRFNYKDFKQLMAVDNTLKLFRAAKEAGIKRIVHVSITNPSENSDLEYFRGKAMLERALVESGMSYSILRPAVLFGKEDILINNISWVLRRFPVFFLFGDGSYRLQPIYVDDLARLAVEQGKETENRIIDAIGPETFTYRGLVEELGDIIGKRRIIISANPSFCYGAGLIIGKIFGDIMITREEIRGLMDDLLYVDSKPVGETKLTDWAKMNRSIIGKRYTSELGRRLILKESYSN